MSSALKFMQQMRSISPKVSYAPGLLSSNGQNSPRPFVKQMKSISNLDPEQFGFVHQENSRLREEIRALRRQINLLKGDKNTSKEFLSVSEKNIQVNDLRQTIKKESGEIRDLKTMLQVLSRQCKMYEEVIEKMESKINKLTSQNKVLQTMNRSSQSNNYNLRKTIQDKSNEDTSSFMRLVQKVTQIAQAFESLEDKFYNDQKQWAILQEKWSLEKTYYLHRINDLEGMLGIGVAAKEEKTSKNKSGGKTLSKKFF